jgi:hypothetical protein
MGGTDGAAWDWAEQKRDTVYTYDQLRKEAGLAPGARITLDLQFLPAETDSDERAFVAALERAGYDVTLTPGDPTVEASMDDTPFTVDAIWKHEERTTRLALNHGYAPDGWGFWDPQGAEDEDD